MSKIDDELAKAVEDSEADEAARPVVVQVISTHHQKPIQRWAFSSGA